MSGSLIFSRIHEIHSSYNNSRTLLESSMGRLATGDRFYHLGEGLGGNLSLSEKYRYRIQTASQATQSLQNGMIYIDQADAYADNIVQVMHRMTELASISLDPIIKDEQRESIDAEYQALIDEISQMTKTNSFYGKQTIGRDAITSFDSNNQTMQFWNINGGDNTSIEKKFDANAMDIHQNYIGFDSGMDFSMSRNGKSLFFLGNDSTGTSINLKRYDIESDILYTSSDAFSSTDKLFIDEQGQLFANASGTIYTIDTNDMSKTATAVTDIAVDQEFSVYKDKITYHSSSNTILQYDINLSSTTTLVANPSGVVSPPPASASNNFAAGSVDHDISASGRYIADEISNDTVRIIDTTTNTGSVIALGSGDNIENIQFNEDEDRLYYVNTGNNEVGFVKIHTNNANNVELSIGESVIQGKQEISLSGLDLGGANYGSIIPFILAEDVSNKLSYEAADLRLYHLGLLNTSVDTIDNAETTLADLKTAMSRAGMQRAKLGAYGSKFRHVMDTHMEYINKTREAEGIVRDVDIAKESTFLSKIQLKNAASAAMITQFNEILQSVLLLINH